ncbi:MAG: PLDc N-terminal domain-containing protein, partial [Clostridia bacterium]|nr:PLDc N-terminal domain-containing protein [Clostridia bacterium]
MGIKLKNKRGIRIQTRIITSAILLLFQLALLAWGVFSLSEHFLATYVISEIIAIIMVIYIINRRGNPSYKIAWIVFILLIPIFGISVFLLWGGGRVMPHLKKRMQLCESHYMPFLEDDEKIRCKLRYEDFPHSRQAEYLSNESKYPIYDGSTVEYLSPGEKFLPRFLEELSKATRYIYIEFFIIAEGKMWDSVYNILRKKAAEGVEVKILFDDFGSIKRQHKDFIDRVQKDGIKIAIFNKIKPSMDVFMNNRNHRKIVVIDGKVAITGGLNLADEYINAIERFGYWLDCAVIIKGKAVKSFLAMFCITWEFTTGRKIDMQTHLSENVEITRGFVLPYADEPLGENNPAEGIYMQILNTAQKYVYIASPYLIIDSTMITVLKMAVKSGVDVRIVTPHIPD